MYIDGECFDCETKDRTIQNAQEFLEGIVEVLYRKEKINWMLLETYLEEICHYLNVKLPKEDLVVIREQSKIEEILPNWIKANNQYLKSLKHA